MLNKKYFYSLFVSTLLFSFSNAMAFKGGSACDVNRDGSVNALDLQTKINNFSLQYAQLTTIKRAMLGGDCYKIQEYFCDLNSSGRIDAIDLQLQMNSYGQVNSEHQRLKSLMDQLMICVSTNQAPSKSCIDQNKDNKIDSMDLQLVINRMLFNERIKTTEMNYLEKIKQSVLQGGKTCGIQSPVSFNRGIPVLCDLNDNGSADAGDLQFAINALMKTDKEIIAIMQAIQGNGCSL